MSAKHGRCLCGAVEYRVDGPLRDVVYCHCKMCRRTSGHFVAATACDLDRFSLTRAEGLRWYQSSSAAKRGFCAVCGANLFWQPTEGGYISIWAGSLDEPTGIKPVEHIFSADKGDYYQIHDGLPQRSGS
jgi:hypothetical protein